MPSGRALSWCGTGQCTHIFQGYFPGYPTGSEATERILEPWIPEYTMRGRKDYIKRLKCRDISRDSGDHFE